MALISSYSDTPHIIHGVQDEYRRLYYSEPMAALKVPVTISGGFGILKMGTALALNGSAAGNIGKCMPYDPSATITGVEPIKRAYLVADSTAAYTVDVRMEESYQFIVGDDLYTIDSGTSEKSLGAITAIDRTTYSHIARITFTIINTADFDVAEFGFITHEGYSTCVGILEKTVDTGWGQYAKGANATLILGNCVLYTGLLINFDSDAVTDLSAATYGNFTYIR